MRKFSIWLASLLLIASTGLANAQTKSISGTVTSADDGLTLPGVAVIVKGTTIGTTTNMEGQYQIDVPANTTTLVFSFIGLKDNEVQIGDQTTVDVVMNSDMFNLDEIIVSGVASGTQRKKLTVSVGKVSSDDLLEVPATNAAAALQGKMAGVQVTTNTGTPGQSATVLIRGATSIAGSQEPLYIVDGAIIEGGLSDLNVDDIESIEVVKGASASALYGSRAGSGVIVITTKRGSNLNDGQTKITLRNEFGINQMANLLDLATHHNYDLKDNPSALYTDYEGVTFPAGYTGGSSADIAGNRILSYDHYSDNNYAYLNDHQDDMYRDGAFYTNYISVANKTGNTNFMISFENSQEEGVMEFTEGYNRKNFRINVDHYISDKFKISASQLIGKSFTQAPGGTSSNGGIFFDVLFMLPDVDFYRDNEENGQPYDIDASQWNTNEENPLYALTQLQKAQDKTYMVGTYGAEWFATDWFTLDAKYAFDRRNSDYTSWTPKGMLQRGGGGLVEDLGSLYKTSSSTFSQTGQITAHLNKQFGDLTTKAKFSYLFEDMHYQSVSATGYDFSVANMPSMGAIVGNKYLSSYQEDVRADNVFGIFQFDMKGKYLADVMVRYDGSSLFGENERWHPYYRVSAAYRISEDVTIPGIQELKIRAAYGTAGQRPGFAAQYETFAFSGGVPVPSTIGNKDLKPANSAELEIGLNMEFLNRFSFEFVYANTNTTDQILRAPLPAYYGYAYQWRNAGSLESTVFEATLGASIIKKKDFSWNANLVFDRIRQTVTELNIPAYQTGPVGQDADQVFFIREGETFGIVYGSKFLTDLNDLAPQLGAGDDISNYEINSDGYVIVKGTQGTVNEKPIKLLDENGNPQKTVIGNTNPDFRIGISNTLKYKNVSLYFLFDWKNGGDVYNRTAQWLYRDLRHIDIDQFGKVENEKKATDYYSTLYDVNDVNSHFVEDASYVKLREMSLYYTLGEKQLSGFANGFFKSVKLGLIGRNLLTITNYTGYDPEVGQVNNGYAGSSQYFQFDAYGYPAYRTVSGSLTLVF